MITVVSEMLARNQQLVTLSPRILIRTSYLRTVFAVVSMTPLARDEEKCKDCSIC